jgi:hypothetical protein
VVAQALAEHQKHAAQYNELAHCLIFPFFTHDRQFLGAAQSDREKPAFGKVEPLQALLAEALTFLNEPLLFLQ